MVNQITIGMFKAYFPWQSEDNITVNYIILIKHCKGFFFPPSEKSETSDQIQSGKTWEGRARATLPSSVNGAQIPPLQNCGSDYSMFYVLVNEIVWGSHDTDHIWFAMFGTIFPPFWKYLTNELGSQEWILAFLDRKSVASNLQRWGSTEEVATKTHLP